MLKKIIKDIYAIKFYYLRNKGKVFKSLSFALFFLFLSMAIVGLRVLYPYQLLFSMPFFVLGVGYALSSLLLDRNKITRSASFLLIKRILIKYKKIIFVIALVYIIFYIFSRVLPNDTDPFLNMSKEEVTLYVDQSVDIATILLDRLETTGSELLGSGLLEKKEFNVDDLAELHSKWEQFLLAAKDSEDMTDVHRYFGKISYFSMQSEHTKSFVISYALYLKKFELFGKIIERTGSNGRVVKALNEYSDVFRAKNSYYDIRDRHIGRDTFLRRNLGRAYILFLEKTVDSTDFGENYGTLLRENKKSYHYLTTHLGDTIDAVAVKYADDVENGLFNSWFPIQKNVANAMGKMIVSSRKSTFITLDQIATMRPFLEPGDIFIERRNWHVSNVGIPGFWPHAALYIGTLKEANIFFQEVFPFGGFNNFSELVSSRYPHFYKTYQEKDDSGYGHAVIEGQAPGIILQSLEKSASADYIGVLRPRLQRKDILKGVLRSFENYGKPYDYNFDFETRDEIVCSELVYDAYLPSFDKKGINFELSITSGRKMISPNDMVKKFYEEKGTVNQALDFVYFIDGNESLGRAFVKDESAFVTSWTRPKFSKSQE